MFNLNEEKNKNLSATLDSDWYDFTASNDIIVNLGFGTEDLAAYEVTGVEMYGYVLDPGYYKISGNILTISGVAAGNALSGMSPGSITSIYITFSLDPAKAGTNQITREIYLPVKATLSNFGLYKVLGGQVQQDSPIPISGGPLTFNATVDNSIANVRPVYDRPDNIGISIFFNGTFISNEAELIAAVLKVGENKIVIEASDGLTYTINIYRTPTSSSGGNSGSSSSSSRSSSSSSSDSASTSSTTPTGDISAANADKLITSLLNSEKAVDVTLGANQTAINMSGSTLKGITDS